MNEFATVANRYPVDTNVVATAPDGTQVRGKVIAWNNQRGMVQIVNPETREPSWWWANQVELLPTEGLNFKEWFLNEVTPEDIATGTVIQFHPFYFIPSVANIVLRTVADIINIGEAPFKSVGKHGWLGVMTAPYYTLKATAQGLWNLTKNLTKHYTRAVRTAELGDFSLATDELKGDYKELWDNFTNSLREILVQLSAEQRKKMLQQINGEIDQEISDPTAQKKAKNQINQIFKSTV